MTKSLRVVFAGTPDFSVPVLERLHQWCEAHQHKLVGVLTQPDRPAGRGRKLRQSPVKEWAITHDIDVNQPISLRQNAQQQWLANARPDLMVVVAYGLLLPPEVLALPLYGCINVHASLLPRWRGAAPIQRAILAGDTRTGVAIMQMDEGLDTGPVWSMVEVPIDPHETGGSLHDKLSLTGANALVEALSEIVTPGNKPIAQPDEGVTYAHKLSKQEGLIDWQQPAVQIARMIRAFNPWPVAHTSLEGRSMRLFEAEVVTTMAPSSAEPGTVIGVDAGFFVATGEGVLNIRKLQPAGGRGMDARSFLNAHSCLHQRFS